jgi:hypothetical protein
LRGQIGLVWDRTLARYLTSPRLRLGPIGMQTACGNRASGYLLTPVTGRAIVVDAVFALGVDRGAHAHDDALRACTNMYFPQSAEMPFPSGRNAGVATL